MKWFIILVAVVGSLNVHAQKLLMFKGEPRISMMPVLLVDSCEIDTTDMIVTYRFERHNSDSSRCWSNIRMEIGGRYMKQMDMHLYYNNLTYGLLRGFYRGYGRENSNRKYTGVLENNGNSNTNLFFELYQDQQAKTRDVICTDYFKSDIPQMYKEKYTEIKWELREARDSIAGFICNTATADINGRIWDVWYTPEIPTQAGPWKLNGLPGLIIKAVDKSNDYRFECLRIENRKEPIYRYKYNSIRDFQNRRRYLKYEQNCYEHPFQTFANGEKSMVATTNETGQMIYLDESWTIPYNPIERE